MAGSAGQRPLPQVGSHGQFYVNSEGNLNDPNGWDPLPQPDRLVLCRNVSKTECSWLTETLAAGTVLWRFHGHTHGVLSHKGVAVTLDYNREPFFEVPMNAVWWKGSEHVPHQFPSSWGEMPYSRQSGAISMVELPAEFGQGSPEKQQWILYRLHSECGLPDLKDQQALRSTQECQY